MRQEKSKGYYRMDIKSWFEGLETIGNLSPDLIAAKLREIGEYEEAESVIKDSQGSSPRISLQLSLKREMPAWQHTSHIFGYIRTAKVSSDNIPIKHAGRIKADESLWTSPAKAYS